MNPFLAAAQRKTIIPSSIGTEPVSETNGSQVTQTGDSGDGHTGSNTVGEDSGRSHILDKHGTKSGNMRIRRSRGISISEIEHDKTERMEAYVSEKDNAVIINTGHPFYRKIEGRMTAEFHKYKIVVEALVRYQANAENWDANIAFNKARDILHAIYD